MAKVIKVENYIVEEPLINILYYIRDILNNGKLKDIEEKADEILCTCPNDEHDGGQENNPDCHIVLRDDKDVPYGTFNCFACNSSGNFIKFVALAFSQSYGWAKTWLIKNYGILAYERLSIGDSIKINAVQKKKYLDDSFLEKLQPWTPYLAERKLDRQICEKFHVKYDPENRQVVFPVYDAQGHLLMAPRRSIDNKFFVLGKEIEKPLYGFNVVQKNNLKACLWVEGPIDMLACFSNGVPAVASLGSPSEEQIKQINRSCITTLYLACDSDEAGQKFNREIKKQLDSRIIVYEVAWPKSCKDAADLSKDQWEEVIKTQHLPKIY